jgi:hypothetical protein
MEGTEMAIDEIILTERIKKILHDFWLLDSSEYTVIKGLIREEIERIRKDSDARTLQFMDVLLEKVEYIISNGMCKRFPNT